MHNSYQTTQQSKSGLPLILEAGDPRKTMFSTEKEAETMQSEEP